MAGIAKLIKALVTLAALVGSVETLIRVARFAWALVIKLSQMTKRRATFGGQRFNFGF